jgi:hypothetical protein
VERELGALAHRPGEDQQRDDPDRDRQAAAVHDQVRVLAEGRDLAGQRRDRVADVQRPEADEDEHDPEREADIADAVDDERLLGGQGRRALAVPEADEQVARQPDQLPGHEDDQEAVRQDEQEHREHEQVQVGEEPPVARVVAHVADRVDVDEQADRGHDDQQAGGQVVDEEADIDLEGARRDPRVVLVAVALVAERRCPGERAERHEHADRPGQPDRSDRDQVGLLAEATPDRRREQEARQRQEDDQGDEQVEHHWLIASYSSTSGVFLLR